MDVLFRLRHDPRHIVCNTVFVNNQHVVSETNEAPTHTAQHRGQTVVTARMNTKICMMPRTLPSDGKDAMHRDELGHVWVRPRPVLHLTNYYMGIQYY